MPGGNADDSTNGRTTTEPPLVGLRNFLVLLEAESTAPSYDVVVAVVVVVKLRETGSSLRDRFFPLRFFSFFSCSAAVWFAFLHPSSSAASVRA